MVTPNNYITEFENWHGATTNANSGSYCAKTLPDKLQRLQNQAVRILTNTCYDADANQLFKELGWDNLETRRQKLKAEMVYKSLNGLAPNYLSSKFIQRSDVITAYNLHDSDGKLAIPLPRTNYYKNSFGYSGAVFWNILVVKNVHKKLLSFVRLRRFGNNPFISRMFQPLGQSQTLTVRVRQMMHMLFEKCLKNIKEESQTYTSGTSMTSLAPPLILDKISRTSSILVQPIILLLSILLR